MASRETLAGWLVFVFVFWMIFEISELDIFGLGLIPHSKASGFSWDFL